MPVVCIIFFSDAVFRWGPNSLKKILKVCIESPCHCCLCNDLALVALKPLIVSDQIIQSACPRSSELVGQRIKLLQSFLVAPTKEEIDIGMIWS